MRRRIAAMVAMVMMVLMMWAPPALTHHDVGHVNSGVGIELGNKSSDCADANKGGDKSIQGMSTLTMAEASSTGEANSTAEVASSPV